MKIIVTRKTALITVLCLFAIFVVYSGVNILPSYGLYREPNSTLAFCMPLNNRDYIENILSWIDGIIYTLVPSSIMIVSNIAIIWKLRQMAIQRKFMSNTESREGDKGNDENKITIMLICVSTFFMLTTMPVGILVIGKYITFVQIWWRGTT